MEGEDIKAAANGCTPHDEPSYSWPEKGIRALWEKTNLKSLDGLPGLQSALGSAPVLIHRERDSKDPQSDGGHARRRWAEHLDVLLDTRFIAGTIVGVAASLISTMWLASP